MGIPNKELLELLTEHGFSLSSIAIVPDKAIELAEKILAKSSPSKEKTELNVLKDHPQEKQIAQETTILKTDNPEPSQRIKKVEEQKITPTPQPSVEPTEAPAEIVLSPMTVADLAQKTHKQVSDVILTLLKEGIAATKNQLLPAKIVAPIG